MLFASATQTASEVDLDMEYLMQGALLVILLVITFAVIYAWAKYKQKKRRP